MRKRWVEGMCAGLIVSLVVSFAGAQTAPPAVPPPPGSQWVWVNLPSMQRGARLEAYEGIKSKDDDDDDAWRKLCDEPCALWIPSGTRLRVDGDFRVSPPFTLPVRPAVKLAVDPARSGARISGIIMIPTFGTIALLSGLVYAATNADPDSSAREIRETRRIAGGFALFGLMGVGVGIALLVGNLKTTVELHDPAAPPRPEAFRGLGSTRVALGRGMWLSPNGLQF